MILWLRPTIGCAATFDIVTNDTRMEVRKYLDVRVVCAGESIAGGANVREWDDDFFIEHKNVMAPTQPD